jgi:hypothetical protein
MMMRAPHHHLFTGLHTPPAASVHQMHTAPSAPVPDEKEAAALAILARSIALLRDQDGLISDGLHSRLEGSLEISLHLPEGGKPSGKFDLRIERKKCGTSTRLFWMTDRLDYYNRLSTDPKHRRLSTFHRGPWEAELLALEPEASRVRSGYR